MKIQLLSDLHLEKSPLEIEVQAVDVLVFAGDLHQGHQGLAWLESLPTTKPIIYVLGNHEYYDERFPGLISELKKRPTNNNIHLLENESILINGVKFHACSLWTDFNLFNKASESITQCQLNLNDFQRIKTNHSNKAALAKKIIEEFEYSINWLGQSLETSNQANIQTNIVITHHAPSIKSAPKKFQNNLLTAAYASNLESFILHHQPDYWLHGHMHNSCNYQIGKCQIISNPRGYSATLNPNFDPNYIIHTKPN